MMQKLRVSFECEVMDDLAYLTASHNSPPNFAPHSKWWSHLSQLDIMRHSRVHIIDES